MTMEANQASSCGRKRKSRCYTVHCLNIEDGWLVVQRAENGDLVDCADFDQVTSPEPVETYYSLDAQGRLVQHLPFCQSGHCRGG